MASVRSPLGGDGLWLLPLGEADSLGIVSQSDYDGNMLTVAVRNNTGRTVRDVGILARANGPSGELLASGSSQFLVPFEVAPGGVAFGQISFDGIELPDDAVYEFVVQDGSEAVDIDEIPSELTIVRAAMSGDVIFGELQNNSESLNVHDPVAFAIGLAPNGTIVGYG